MRVAAFAFLLTFFLNQEVYGQDQIASVKEGTTVVLKLSDFQDPDGTEVVPTEISVKVYDDRTEQVLMTETLVTPATVVKVKLGQDSSSIVRKPAKANSNEKHIAHVRITYTYLAQSFYTVRLIPFYVEDLPWVDNLDE